jgi:hypothetical protein
MVVTSWIEQNHRVLGIVNDTLEVRQQGVRTDNLIRLANTSDKYDVTFFDV